MTTPSIDWRDSLPTPSDQRIAVRATADAIRQLRGGSPWLYDGSIVSVNHEGVAGDLAVVFDDHRRFVAIGLYDPSSPIRVKVVHTGDPVAIDATFWDRALSTALERREALAADKATTAYRCVHGENDGLPGLVIDRYDTTYVVKLYSPAWFAHLASIVDVLAARVATNSIVLRLSRTVQSSVTFGLTDGAALVGHVPSAPVVFRERGLVMEADVVHGQKTGHFLDQRDNRALVRGMSAGCDVLDVFASTGGFALSAAAGGARSVHLVDLSPQAIATAQRNIAHNERIREVRQCTVRTTVGDAFEALDRLGRTSDHERFDIVIIDPPSFASAQSQVERALRAYSKLTRLGVTLLRPGGTLVQASCSSRVDADAFFETVVDSARSAGRPLRETRRTGHAVDHPIGFAQGAYLKAIFAVAS